MIVAYVRPRSALGAASAGAVADLRLRGSWEPPAILGLSSTRVEHSQEPTVPRNFRDGKGDHGTLMLPLRHTPGRHRVYTYG